MQGPEEIEMQVFAETGSSEGDADAEVGAQDAVLGNAENLLVTTINPEILEAMHAHIATMVAGILNVTMVIEPLVTLPVVVMPLLASTVENILAQQHTSLIAQFVNPFYANLGAHNHPTWANHAAHPAPGHPLTPDFGDFEDDFAARSAGG
jgi:hypothetical protein